MAKQKKKDWRRFVGGSKENVKMKPDLKKAPAALVPHYHAGKYLYSKAFHKTHGDIKSRS